ncbi:MAG: acyltransferase [Clostridia bacterium]
MKTKTKNQSQIKTLSQKNEYIFVDIAKVLCALLVVTIHISMFSDVSVSLSHWVNEYLARVAVPFFFVSSGYFIASKMSDRKVFFAYIKRMCKLYGLYTLVCAPMIIEDWVTNKTSLILDILYFITKIFLTGTGTYYVLWFYVALIIGSIILFYAINKFKFSDKKLLLVSAVLYCVGVIGNSYAEFWSDLPVIGSVYDVYILAFRNTRNGLFFGFFFLALGYLIRKHNEKIRKTKLNLILLLVAFAALNVEGQLVTYFSGETKLEMLFLTPVVAVLAFIVVSFVSIPEKFAKFGLNMRKISVMIYGSHLLVNFIVSTLLVSVFALELHSLIYYFVVAGLTFGLGCATIKLQKFKRFSWLEYLY